MNIIKNQGWMLLLFISITAHAQVDPDQKEARLAAFRAEVFTRVLKLTPDEAQGFWPVYNEYADKREQVQQDLRPGKQLDQMSDAEVEEQIKRHQQDPVSGKTEMKRHSVEECGGNHKKRSSDSQKNFFLYPNT